MDDSVLNSEGQAENNASAGQENADQQQQEEQPEEDVDMEEKWQFLKEDENSSEASSQNKKAESEADPAGAEGLDAEIAKYLEDHPQATGANAAP